MTTRVAENRGRRGGRSRRGYKYGVLYFTHLTDQTWDTSQFISLLTQVTCLHATPPAAARSPENGVSVTISESRFSEKKAEGELYSTQ